MSVIFKVSALHDAHDAARKNLEALAGCRLPHNFVRIEPHNPLSRFRCTHCGAQVDRSHAHWYQRGIEHGLAIAKGDLKP